MLTRVRLVEGTREMLIRPRDGVGLSQLDPGFPEMRAVVEARTDRDGTVDNTALFGASAVSMTLNFYKYGTTRALLAELRTFCHPGLRPWLYVADDEWEQERRIRLRADQQTAPIAAKRGYLREVQVAWKAPDGVWESAELVSMSPISADIQTSTGITYPVTYPVSYGVSQGAGASIVSNLGHVPSHFTARLYGPCTAPTLRNESSGEVIAFTSDLTLNEGDYVEINTRDRSAYFKSDTSLSRLNNIDFEATSWWPMDPGDQQIRYAPETASPGAAAEIDYRPAWL